MLVGVHKIGDENAIVFLTNLQLVRSQLKIYGTAYREHVLIKL